MASPERKADWRARRKAKRDLAREHGLCIICLKTIVLGGRSTCIACGERSNAAKRKAKKKTAGRPASSELK